jgi:hypothetical protein
VADDAIPVDQEDALLHGGHGVMVEPTDEVPVHDVEPGAPELRTRVAVGERVREAHHRRARRLEGTPVAEPVDREEPLVRIADKGVGRRAMAEEDAGGLQQVRTDLDDLGAGGLEQLVALAHAIHVDPAERAGEAAGEPDHHVRAAAVRGELYGLALHRGQAEERRRLADGRRLGNGRHEPKVARSPQGPAQIDLLTGPPGLATLAGNQ